MISIVVAQAHDRVIGNKGDQPFYLPADLKHFKELTTGHTVIMGRKTYEAIRNHLGHMLPNRTNIVLSQSLQSGSDYQVVDSLEEATALVPQGEEGFIIGGAQVYESSINIADRIYVTEVDADFKGDTFFPLIDSSIWNETDRESHPADEKNQYPYAFVTLERTR